MRGGQRENRSAHDKVEVADGEFTGAGGEGTERSAQLGVTVEDASRDAGLHRGNERDSCEECGESEEEREGKQEKSEESQAVERVVRPVALTGVPMN